MSYNKETGMYEGYIYVIENLTNGKKYIGQTTETIEKRWIKHRSSAKREQKYYIHKSMHKYGEDNFIISELSSILCEEKEDLRNHLNYLERYYIKKYNTENHKFGYNLTPGGDETGIKNRVKIIQYDLYGNTIKIWESMVEASEFYRLERESIWAACNGKTMTCNNYVWRYEGDSFYKYSVGNLAKSREKHIKNVKKYDCYGKLLNTYSYKEITNIYGKSGKYSIYEVCDGKKEYYKDCVWRYEDDEFDKYPINSLLSKINNREEKKNKIKNKQRKQKEKPKPKMLKENTGRFKSKMVNCYDADNVFVKTYISITEAGNAVGLKNSYNITNVCNKRRNFAGGYRWYFANDPNQPDKTKIIN